MIFRDGWYYLLVTHGSCCAGANSTYNIRMGRSRKVTGPFLDNMGIDMLQGGGKLFLGSERPLHRPGTFRPARSRRRRAEVLLHYEADLDRGGISVLDIRPLLWRDGWPVAGDNFTRGHLPDRVGAHRHGARTGGAGRAGRRRARTRRPRRPGRGARGRRRGAGAGRAAGGRGGRRRRPWRCAAGGADPAAGCRAGLRELARRADRRAHGALHGAGAAEVDDHAGRQRRRLSRLAVFQDHDRRHRPRAGGDRGRELVALPAFTGAPEQLWRIDQLTDGTYRIMPKAVPDSKEPLALSAVGSSMPTLAKFDPDERPAALAAQGTLMTCHCMSPSFAVVARRDAGRRCAARRRQTRGRSPACSPPRSRSRPATPVEGARCRRLHPALADPRADPRDRTTDRQRRAGRSSRPSTSPISSASIPRDGDKVTVGDTRARPGTPSTRSATTSISSTSRTR